MANLAEFFMGGSILMEPYVATSEPFLPREGCQLGAQHRLRLKRSICHSLRALLANPSKLHDSRPCERCVDTVHRNFSEVLVHFAAIHPENRLGALQSILFLDVQRKPESLWLRIGDWNRN